MICGAYTVTFTRRYSRARK